MTLLPESKRGFVLAVSAPSGTGKTSLCDQLAREFDFVIRSISVTVRPQRVGEISGRDYQFVTQKEFEELRSSGALLESAEVFGCWYGTLKKPVTEAIQNGKIIVMDIDTVGAFNIRNILGKDSVLVFIVPPSLEEFERRLRDRGTDPAEVLRIRLNEASRSEEHTSE